MMEMMDDQDSDSRVGCFFFFFLSFFLSLSLEPVPLSGSIPRGRTPVPCSQQCCRYVSALQP